MGIISDTFEDNNERVGQILESVESYLEAGSTERPDSTVRCPFCLRPFFTQDEFFLHAQKDHGPQYVYLRLNGAIIRDVGWAETGIRECQLALLGHHVATVQITTPSYEKEVTAKSGIDLQNEMPLDVEGEIRIVVKPSGASPRTFILYNRSIPDFRSAELDETISDLNRLIDQSTHRPEIHNWLSRLRALARTNHLATRYGEGFYEYALGSSLERFGQKNEAKSHLEESFGLLMPFRTKLAMTAKRVLGLKMNSFEILKDCSSKSPFAPADAFFNGRDLQAPDETHVVSSLKGVYIDSFSKLFLNGLVSFYNIDDQSLVAITGALTQDLLSRGKNNRNKLSLLTARWHRRRGSLDQAIQAYEPLRFDPIFGDEARLFLDDNRRRDTSRTSYKTEAS